MSLSAAIRSRVPQKVAPPPPGFPRARVPKPKIQKPIWAMTDAELLAVARGQAEAAYKPQIDALERQRKDTVNANQAAQAGLAKLLEALQAGTSGYSDEIANIFRDAQRQVNAYANDKGSNLDVVNRMYEGEGQAYAGAGKAQAGLIGNEGQLRYLAAVQEQNKQLSEIGADIAEVQGKIPGATQDALSDLYKARDDYFEATKPILRTVGGNLYAIDPQTGRVQPLIKAPGKPRAVNTALSKAMGVWVDSYGRPIKGITAPVPQADPSTPKVNLSLSKALGYWADSTGAPIPGLSGAPPKTPGRKPKPPSAAVLKAGWKLINDSYYHAPGSSKRLTDDDLKRILNRVNASRAAFNKANDLSEGEKGYRPPITADLLPRMTTGQLRSLGIAGQKRDPQDVYLDLVHSGIPARRAWQMVRKANPGWGEGYFNPKASATQSVAYTSPNIEGAINLVKEYLGTPYSWGGGGPGGPSYGIGRGAKTRGFDCSALLQFMYGKLGISIPRVTYDQWKTGTPVEKNHLSPGDAVFFHPGSRGPEHVGIYIGGGKFIEAPYTGSVVRISDMSSRRDYMGARRWYNARNV